MYPTTGYVKELTAEQKRSNLRATLEQFVSEHPGNYFWETWLAEVVSQEEREAAERAREAEWTGEPETIQEAIAAAYGLAAEVQIGMDAARARLLQEWAWEAEHETRGAIISGGEVMEI